MAKSSTKASQNAANDGDQAPDNANPATAEAANQAQAGADAVTEAAGKDDGAAGDTSTGPANEEGQAENAATAVDIATLKRLCGKVDSMVKVSPQQLVDDLRQNDGLKIEGPDDTGSGTLTMAGITTRANSNVRQSLTNWANAARRAILKAG